MSATGAGYDLSVSTYSPNGRVFQVEYATKAVEKKATSLGIRCKDGIVLAVEKVIPSKLLLRKANHRIYSLAPHIGLTSSGLAPDCRVLLEEARKEAREYANKTESPISGELLAKRVAAHMHEYTQYWNLRPYGCSVIIGAFSEEAKVPELFSIAPSGVFHGYNAVALGKHATAANTDLERLDYSALTVEEAAEQAAKIIYKHHDDVKDKDFELEVSWICEQSGFKHRMIPSDLYDRVVASAVEHKRRLEMDSDDEYDEEGEEGS